MDEELTVEVDGIVWRAGDFGIDADGDVVMVYRKESSGEIPFKDPRYPDPCLAWAIMGSECGGFRIGSKYDVVPRPIIKMKLVSVEEE